MADMVLVTGAAGFIGRNLCRQLLNDGFRVRALVRKLDSDLDESAAQVVQADLNDKKALVSALKGVKVVIHCAGDAKFGNGKKRYYQTNILTTENLLWAIKEQDDPSLRLIFVSTIGAIDRARYDFCTKPLDENSQPRPTSDYGRSKLECENIIKKSGLDYVILRPSMVVGDGMRLNSHFSAFSQQKARRSIFSKLPWTGAFSVIHVEDLCRAIILIAGQRDIEGDTYFCAGTKIRLLDFFKSDSVLSSKTARFFFKSVFALPAVFSFRIKSLFFDSLVASDAKLQSLGWRQRVEVGKWLSSRVTLEEARNDGNIIFPGDTLITGAASGLGYALFQELKDKRRRIILVDRNAEALSKIGSHYGNVETIECDLSSSIEVKRLCANLQKSGFDIWELFSCAGVGSRDPIHVSDTESLESIFDVNLKSRLILAQFVVRRMLPKRFGRIVLISSSSAFIPLPFMATYSASNAGLLSLGTAWSTEVRPYGIDLKVICPGGMATNFQKSSGVKETNFENLMSPNKVANKIVASLGSNKIHIIISARSLLMKYLGTFVPVRVNQWLWAILMEKMR